MCARKGKAAKALRSTAVGELRSAYRLNPPLPFEAKDGWEGHRQVKSPDRPSISWSGVTSMPGG